MAEDIPLHTSLVYTIIYTRMVFNNDYGIYKHNAAVIFIMPANNIMSFSFPCGLNPIKRKSGMFIVRTTEVDLFYRVNRWGTYYQNCT